MWMWWDHYIYCNFWAHAVVHRVHHTPTRRLESARFIWLGAIFLGVRCPVSVGCQQSGSRISTWTGSGLQTPRPSRARMRAHARAAPRLYGSQESGEVARTRSRDHRRKAEKIPPCSPRDRTRRAGAELMRRFGTIPCRLDSQLDQTLSSLLSQVHTGHRILLELRPVWRACHSPLPAKLMRVVFA